MSTQANPLVAYRKFTPAVERGTKYAIEMLRQDARVAQDTIDRGEPGADPADLLAAREWLIAQVGKRADINETTEQSSQTGICAQGEVG